MKPLGTMLAVKKKAEEELEHLGSTEKKRNLWVVDGFESGVGIEAITVLPVYSSQWRWMGKSVGKNMVVHAFFLAMFGHIGMGVGPVLLPYQKLRSPHACSGLLALCGNNCPCFRLNVYFFILHKYMHQRTWACPPLSVSPTGIGLESGSFSCSTK